MTRVLDALKALESRRQAEAKQTPRRPVSPPDDPGAPRATPPPVTDSSSGDVQLSSTETEDSRRAARAQAVSHMCLLPTVPVVGDHYHETAEQITEQLSTNYCNVVLFVCPDEAAKSGFSMTHLAQAFSLQSAGDVLLVDGDFRDGHLSQSVCPHGPGVVEAMLGAASWPAVIHSTTTPRVDFAPRGQGQVPADEPAEFGWGALRPKYRAVLIGVADTWAPETAWVAAHADAVYVLISRPDTKRQVAADAVEALRACGAHLMGCIVVND